MFRAADADGNGVISLSEYLAHAAGSARGAVLPLNGNTYGARRASSQSAGRGTTTDLLRARVSTSEALSRIGAEADPQWATAKSSPRRAPAREASTDGARHLQVAQSGKARTTAKSLSAMGRRRLQSQSSLLTCATDEGLTLCMDSPRNWQDADGNSCDDYARNDYCTVTGNGILRIGLVLGFSTTWGTLLPENYGAEALGAQSRAYIIVIFAYDFGQLMEQAYAAGVGGEGYVWIGSDTTDTIWEAMPSQLSQQQRNNIMRGYLGPVPYVNTSTPEYMAFAERWAAQPATVDEETGECSDAVDDAGAPIWRRYDVDHNKTTFDACIGLNYSDTKNISLFAAYYYDAAYVMARAFHELLVNSSKALSPEALTEAMLEQSFWGASGHVSFDDAGERAGTVQYEVLNHAGESQLQRVAFWSPDLNYAECVAGCHPVVWSTAHRLTYAYGLQNFSEVVTGLRETGAYIIVLFGHSYDAALLLEQAYAAGVGGEGYVWIGSDGTATSSTWNSMSVELSDEDKNAIMRGYLGLTPYIDTSTPEYMAFAERWAAQPATVDEVTGECSDEVDDAGVPIWMWDEVVNVFYEVLNHAGDSQLRHIGSWNAASKFTECAEAALDTADCHPVVWSTGMGMVPKTSYLHIGLLVAMLDEDEVNASDPFSDYFSMLTYDAVFVVSKALHELVEVRGRIKIDGLELMEAMLEQSFTGVTGLVEFKPDGDRTGDMFYEVIQLVQGTSPSTRQVGTWSIASKYEEWDGTVPVTSYVNIGAAGGLVGNVSGSMLNLDYGEHALTFSSYDTEDLSEVVAGLQRSRVYIIVVFAYVVEIGRLMEQAYAAGVGGDGYVWIGSDTSARMWEAMSSQLSEQQRNNIMRGYLGP
eukprot:gene10617-12556_t